MSFLRQNWFRAILVVIIVVSVFFIFSDYSSADVWVNGYYRSNGTYVNGHYRSSPNSNPYDNYSYPGNTNPYTGKVAPGNPDTYLKNYYDNGGSSYYGGRSTYGTTPTYTTWTPTPTPSCPLMSSYNSSTGSCQCYSGYVSDGSSCVSGSSYCWDKYGYNSAYNSLNKSCECDYGYELKYGTCTRKETDNLRAYYYLPTPTPTINFSASCQQKYGAESRYNSATEKCEYCNTGYRLIGDKCYTNTTNTPTPTPASAQPMIPTVIRPSPIQPLSCSSGFSLSLDKKRCVKIPNNAHVVNDGKNVWLCNDKYLEIGSPCVLGASAPSPTTTPKNASENKPGFWSKLRFW